MTRKSLELQRPRRIRTYVAVMLTVGLTVADWPLRLTNDFWAEYPMLSAVVSGVVLLVFALFVVEEWLDRRDERRWERVGWMAVRNLANELRRTSRSLIQMTGQATFDDKGSRPLDPVEATAIAELVESAGVTKDMGMSDALVRLLGHREWTVLAQRIAQARSERLVGLVAQWLPLMIGTNRTHDLVEPLADAVDAVTSCQWRLIEARDAGPLSADAKQSAAGAWMASIDLLDQVRDDMLTAVSEDARMRGHRRAANNADRLLGGSLPHPEQ